MTISHPANVKNILASGVDSLVLSMDIEWKDASIFAVLDEAKEQAKKNGVDYQGQIKHFIPEEVWPFTIKPHGTKGFSWILLGKDFTYKINNTIKPNSRPNVMIEIRSEALWRLGPEEAIKIALGIITANQGRIVETKLSRVGLCVDFLMPEKRWAFELMEYFVTRAADVALHFHYQKLTGIAIGKGNISARLYDKPSEIQQKSKKEWMYDIWGIKELPEGKKIIRFEFQLRREVLKDLGLKTHEDLFHKADQAWSYCTKDWLKFQDSPGLHHTQRSTFKWYEEIQDGFRGVQGAEPLVRKKAIKMDKKKLMQQATGLIQSLHAINQEVKGVDQNKPVNMEDCINSYVNEVNKNRPDPSEVQEKVTRKRARFHREEPMIEEGQTIYRLKNVDRR